MRVSVVVVVVVGYGWGDEMEKYRRKGGDTRAYRGHVELGHVMRFLECRHVLCFFPGRILYFCNF